MKRLVQIDNRNMQTDYYNALHEGYASKWLRSRENSLLLVLK
jgi:hypothetical protein